MDDVSQNTDVLWTGGVQAALADVNGLNGRERGTNGHPCQNQKTKNPNKETMREWCLLGSLLLSWISFASLFYSVTCKDEDVNYGVDVSYPMHGYKVTSNYDWLPWNIDDSIDVPDGYKGMPLQPLGDKQSFYEDQIQTCKTNMQGKKGRNCRSYENARIDRCVRQPKGVYNYTKVGYHKTKAPPELFETIEAFWKRNKEKAKIVEAWDTGNTAVNHWESPTYRVPVEDDLLSGGGPRLVQQVFEGIEEIMMEWTGQHQVPTSVYGIRIYQTGAILAPHVDRLPLVSSAIINVDQDLDEPWPLEVIGHDGLAKNITMEPGDLVLYESHSIIHGGKYMANLFIHFEPVGSIESDVKKLDFPTYIVRGSETEMEWQLLNRGGYHPRIELLRNGKMGSEL